MWIWDWVKGFADWPLVEKLIGIILSFLSLAGLALSGIGRLGTVAGWVWRRGKPKPIGILNIPAGRKVVGRG